MLVHRLSKSISSALYIHEFYPMYVGPYVFKLVLSIVYIYKYYCSGHCSWPICLQSSFFQLYIFTIDIPSICWSRRFNILSISATFVYIFIIVLFFVSWSIPFINKFFLSVANIHHCSVLCILIHFLST